MKKKLVIKKNLLCEKKMWWKKYWWTKYRDKERTNCDGKFMTKVVSNEIYLFILFFFFSIYKIIRYKKIGGL